MSLEQFFSAWGSEEELERKNRILVSMAAYAYEYMHVSIMSDGDFDALCLQINLDLPTGNPSLDKFFREQFDPSTGMWIHNHPEKHKLARLLKLRLP